MRERESKSAIYYNGRRLFHERKRERVEGVCVCAMWGCIFVGMERVRRGRGNDGGSGMARRVDRCLLR